MKSQLWVECLTPLTAGMAVTLLIVATIVGTARAEDNICLQCQDYWYYRGVKEGVCDKYKNPSYERQQCLTQYYMDWCWGEGKPCPNSGNLPPTMDCSSDECNYYAYMQNPDISVCDWDCWNRSCSETNVCLDRQKKCDPGDPSYKCSECRCNP